MAQVSDEQLREMAAHRGLRLLKSRRRKPGTGDFGKFGLTDMSGNALLGIGEEGLTASLDEIQDFLRRSEQNTWKQSADAAPDRAAHKRERLPEPEDEDEPVCRRGKRVSPARPVRREREGRAAARPESSAKDKRKPHLRLVPKAPPEPEPEPEPRPEPESEPVLRVRAATEGDADALAALLSQLGGVALERADVTANLANARKAKAGMVVAELGELVGCCGWAVVATIHRGAIGRLTVLVVDKGHRRRGIGKAMLAVAETALAKAGCHQIEATSDIAINNSHNFFRALKFEQASYRFARTIGK